MAVRDGVTGRAAMFAGWSWRCALGFHAWQKWGPVNRVRMTSDPETVWATYTATVNKPIVWDEYHQERTCSHCGIVQRREVTDKP